MAKAIALRDGKLTEINVPELAVFRRQGSSWIMVKPADTVSLTGSTLTFNEPGWYQVTNSGWSEYAVGDTIALGFFPSRRRILGPFE